MSEIISFNRVRPGDQGYLFHNRAEPLPIDVTEANCHLFSRNPDSRRVELVYQHSANIVEFLRAHVEIGGQLLEHRLAYVDKHGQFYDDVRLVELPLLVHQESSVNEKHIAKFLVEAEVGEKPNPRIVPIDDIYCISYTQQPAA